ncbi:hypothetical protein WIW50_11560 [Flavobacteriaceae bacterium 3-367]
MQIAVLGWGSLIWDPRDLKSGKNWNKDGPLLPIEFARISDNGRLTLVICSNSNQVNVLWTMMEHKSLEMARENLKEREGTLNIDRIGYVNLVDNTQSSRYDGIAEVIIPWAKSKKLGAVIWTDLGVRFKDKIQKDLNLKNIIDYLGNLNSTKKELAKEYIMNAPKQINTEYRKGIEESLGWKKRNLWQSILRCIQLERKG